MNLHTARTHLREFREAIIEAEALPKGQRLAKLNKAWRRHGLPVQEAMALDPLMLTKAFSQMLAAYGRATADAQRVAA